MADGGGFPWPGKAKAAVSFTFDDARASQLDAGLPLFDALNLKATFYVSPGPLHQHSDRWRKAAGSGHELGNHTYAHPCSTNFAWSGERALEEWTIQKIDQDIRHADAVLEKSVGVQARTFAYPCGQTTVGRGELLESYIPVIAKRFLAGRGYLSEFVNNPFRCDLAHLGSTRCDRCTLADLESWITRAVEEGGWLIFTGHDIGEDAGYHTTRARVLEQLLRGLVDRSGEIWTTPVAEAAVWIREHRETLPGEIPPAKR